MLYKVHIVTCPSRSVYGALLHTLQVLLALKNLRPPRRQRLLLVSRRLPKRSRRLKHLGHQVKKKHHSSPRSKRRKARCLSPPQRHCSQQLRRQCLGSSSDSQSDSSDSLERCLLRDGIGGADVSTCTTATGKQLITVRVGNQAGVPKQSGP